MVRGPEGERHIAVVPNTTETARLAGRMRSRCHAAGIEIALVEANGAISYAAA